MRLAWPRPKGQALAEFALVFPIFILLVFGIIVFGIGIFYQQQVTNAAREAARYAAIHSAGAQCPTVSQINPIGGNRPPDYDRCDAPENGWLRLRRAGRSQIWAMDASSVHLVPCWSGYVDTPPDPALPPNADVMPSTQGAVFADCTIQGSNPQASPDAIGCDASLTTAPSAYGVDGGKADGDDKASSLAFGSNTTYPSRVTIYACYVWRPPMAGFLFLPSSVMFRAVVTEAMQRQ